MTRIVKSSLDTVSPDLLSFPVLPRPTEPKTTLRPEPLVFDSDSETAMEKLTSQGLHSVRQSYPWSLGLTIPPMPDRCVSASFAPTAMSMRAFDMNSLSSITAVFGLTAQR